MEVTAPNFSSKAQADMVLIKDAIAGSQRAYAQLMDHYRDAVYFMLLKMVTNSTDAEDLTMEVFAKAFKNIKNYTPSFAFSTWLFKIASNHAIDFIRSKKQMNHVPIDESDPDSAPIQVSDDSPSPEESMINEQTVLMLRAVVAKLKPRYRRLVELRYFYEYTYEEICQEMNMPIGSVKAQLYRAKELLLNILKNRKSELINK